MTQIEAIVTQLRTSPRVRIHPAAGTPDVPTHLTLPSDLAEFYSLCGGIDFLADGHDHLEYRIVEPTEVVDIGTATILEASTELPLSAWYVVGEDDNREHVTVDLHPSRNGTCYDVFHETFSLPDYANVVAVSFTDFLDRLRRRGRAYWFDKGLARQPFGTPASDG